MRKSDVKVNKLVRIFVSQSGMQLPREQQHIYSYGQPPQQYHSGEQFPGHMHHLHHQADFTQVCSQTADHNLHERNHSLKGTSLVCTEKNQMAAQ